MKRQYPEYKDSGIEWIGQVPKDWKVNRLKTFCTFIYGDSLTNEDRVEGDIPVYGSNGIVGYHNKAITHKPCIIIGRKGSYGKVNFSQTECFPIDTTYFVDNRLARCDLKWLNYALPLLELDKFSKDTGVPGLNREDAHDKRVPVPESDVQKSIVGYLDRKTAQIDDLIAKKERMIELLKEERAAIINQAVTKGPNPGVEMKDSGIDWLGKIPKYWEVKKLKYVADKVQTGITPPSENTEYYDDGNIDWYTPGDFQGSVKLRNSFRKINRLAIEKGVARTFPPYSVLLIGIGATLGKVGIIEKLSSSNQQINAITFSNKFNPFFGVYYLQAIANPVVSLSNASTLAILNQTQTKDILVLVPPLEEQGKIVQYIQSVELKHAEIVNREQKQIDLLKEYRTSLISEVVTGKIDVSTTLNTGVRG